MNTKYDIIVLGAGSGGLTVALGLAAAGKKVALIERGKIGGDCTNYGCIPSKALIDIAKSGEYPFSEAMTETRKRRKGIQDEETPEKIAAHGITVIAGSGSFKDSHTISIDGEKEITAKYIVISTGSHANTLEFPGVDSDDILTNETIFEITEDMKNLVIIGGGYIGCELAEAFANLGVQVTIIQRNNRLIPREESESSLLLDEILRKKEIKILTKANAERGEAGFLIVKDEDDEIQNIQYDKILVALGRTPNIEGLNLEKIGIKSNKGVIVDSYNRTNLKHIFAIGDCVEGNPQFTHLANNEGRGVVRNILVSFWKKPVRDFILPSVLYTEHEIARVGKTREELLQNIGEEDFRTEILSFSTNDRSLVSEDIGGFIQVHFARISGKILGATLYCRHAGEMISTLTLAMQKSISAYRLADIIFPYPTKSEIIKKVSHQFVIHTLSQYRQEVVYLFKKHILQLCTIILWGLLIAYFFYFKETQGLTNLDIAQKLYLFFLQSQWSPVLYVLVYTIRPLIFFPASFLSLMSGNLYGIGMGVLYDIIGATLSAVLAYNLGKIFGKQIIPHNATGILDRLRKKVKKKSFLQILLVRLLFFPFDLVSYGAGVLRARGSGFFWGTLFGIIPGALVFVTAGASVQNIETFDFSQIRFDGKILSGSAVLFLISLILAKVLKKWESKAISKK